MKEGIYGDSLSAIRCKDTLITLFAPHWRLMFDQVGLNNFVFFAFQIWPSCSCCRVVELVAATAPIDFCQSFMSFQ